MGSAHDHTNHEAHYARFQNRGERDIGECGAALHHVHVRVWVGGDERLEPGQPLVQRSTEFGGKRFHLHWIHLVGGVIERSGGQQVARCLVNLHTKRVR